TEAQICTVCTAELVPAKGHTPGEEATCTTNQTCTVCGVELAKELGHNTVIDKAVEPSCTETGLTEGSHCDRCNHVFVPQEPIKELGHNEVIDKAKDPSCTETGLTEGSHCDRCGHVFVPQTTIGKLNHVPGVEANCTEAQVCTLCKTYVFVPALGHDYMHLDYKAPTRTEDGYEAHDVCTECGESTPYEKIPALGEASIDNFDDFITNLMLLEEIAAQYVKQYPAKDPVALVIKYIRTGVERYNSGSWGIMAGYEDADFAKFVTDMENSINAEVTDGNYLEVTGLKDLKNFALPNGNNADIGHVFGAMDITYHNKFGQNHTDVSGWAGDLVDLLELSATMGTSGSLEAMVTTVGDKYFLHTVSQSSLPSFSKEDWDGDMDAYYVMDVLKSVEYGIAYTDDGELDFNDKIYSLAEIFMNYMTEDLTDEYRAAYFMTNRLETNGTRSQVRSAVYTEYLANALLATLEGTRDLSGATDLNLLRRAVCYAFADYICKLAGDYVETIENPYYTDTSSSSVQLAPGITQEIHYAMSADGKQMVYYLATGDITRGDVHVYANYANNDPTLGWEMQRVEDQANAAQQNRGDPASPNYIPNYNVIASVNADGFNMSTGEPSGILIMDGKVHHNINNSGFFGITKSGKAVIGTTAEYNATYRNELKEAVGGFGTMLIRNGEIAVSRTDNYYTQRASRTAVGITRTGKVVFMVLDGRQEPFSCGGSMQEIAQIMFEAGCVEAVNLDGGGSTTFVARQPGDDALSVVNSPSDGYARSVSTSLLMVSTAPSSTEFDHAMIESEYKYATIGSPVQMSGKGISPAGNETELPEGYTWAVSDDRFATISADGVFTGLRNGTVEVRMMLDGEVIGVTEMHVVVPDNVYFTRTHMDAVYGANTTLPVAASYENKSVLINDGDIKFMFDKANVGTINGNVFVASEAAGVKVVTITACLASDESVCGSITLNLFKQGENTFDFDMATGGDRQFAWLRDITNATTVDGITYAAIDLNEKMTTSYVFAIDMTQIPIPQQLSDLVYMLPGADAADASAWNFLLQLAERVSVLTEITAIIDFDDNMIVDITELDIKNEYFSLTSKTFDEETNTLTLKLNWIDQTKAIDPATANPLCMLQGIKLTPKDGAMEASQNRLSVVTTGNLSYKGYLRANALYSFAQKPENQAIYGLHPFVNPDLPSESGAWFGTTYTTFEDSYTLAYIVKDGWTVEGGGFAYYQDGEKLYGIHKIDGYYYDFGENGINKDQTKFTGMFFDTDAGGYRYAELGVLAGGWKQVNGDWYCFDEKTFEALDGTHYNEKAIIFSFDNGRLLSGTWVKTKSGMRYWYGPGYYKDTTPVAVSSKPYVIDGKIYLFNKNGYLDTNVIVRSFTGSYNGNAPIYEYYDCGPDGVATPLTGVYDGYMIINGSRVERYALIEANGDYYFVGDNRKITVNQSIYLSDAYLAGFTYEDGTPWAAGYYTFGADGKMVIKNGVYDGYLYIKNQKVERYGLAELNGDHYFVGDNNKVVLNKTMYLSGEDLAGFTYADGTPMIPGYYGFDASAKMIIKNGVYNGFMYINNQRIDKNTLVDFEGAFYYVGETRKVIMNKSVYLPEEVLTGFTYEDGTPLRAGWYDFDAEGKMILRNGIYDGFMYIHNERVERYALIEFEGHRYFVSDYRKIVVNKSVYLTEEYLEGFMHDDGTPLTPGWYDFDAEGKMVIKNGIYDGFMYVNNVKVERYAVIEYNGHYYFVGDYRKVQTNKTIYLTEQYLEGFTYPDGTPLKPGYYDFDAEGKMVIKNGVYDGYMYINNERVNRYALIELDGNFYFVGDYRKVAMDTTVGLPASYVVGLTFPDGCMIEVGNHYFDATGKLVHNH
ncbi:MAG: phosphodiester glycosidase family protein, partial [Clostridia bacterium]|nr:phosphodiester glycosidase family protein [Clostridia bacterium]